MIGIANRNDYIGTGLLATYSYGFKIFAATDLSVVIRDTNGTESVLSYPSQFTVTGVGAAAGGTVVLATALGLNYAMSIRRVRPLSQATDVRNQAQFNRATIEDQFDDIVMQTQQLEDSVERTIRVQESLARGAYSLVLPLPAANKAIGWDATGKVLTNLDTNAVTPSSMASQNVTHLHTGAGSVVESVRSKLGEMVSVKDFGAVANGVTDDTPAIQLATASGARHLIFPAGTYLIKMSQTLGSWTGVDGLVLEFQGCKLLFDAAQVWPTSLWSMFAFNGCTNVEIRGLVRLTGNLTTARFATGTADGPIGFYFDNGCKRVKIGTVIARNIGIGVEFDRRPSLKAISCPYIGNGGAGYTVADILTISGGTPAVATQFNVTSVNAGVITGVSLRTAGLYTGVDQGAVTIPTVANGDDGCSVTGGTGAGAKLNVQWVEADETTLNETIDIDVIDADTCWYALDISYGARHVNVKNLVANNIYRALVAFGGIEDMLVNVIFRNHLGDCIAGGSAYGLGMKNVRLNVTALPIDWAYGATNASKVRLSFENNHPAIFDDIQVRLNINYGTHTNNGGSAIEIDSTSTKGRGSIFTGFHVLGGITGQQNEDSGCGSNTVIGSNINATWTANDYWGNWKIGPLMINSDNTHRIEFHPIVFGYTLTFDSVYMAGSICMNNTSGAATAYLTTRGHFEAVNCVFANQFASLAGPLVAGFGIIANGSATAITAPMSGYTFRAGAGSGGTTVDTLPAATVGLKYKFRNGDTNAGTIKRFSPFAGEKFVGQAANAKLSLDTLGAAAEIECQTAGVWTLVSSIGTITYV